MKSIFAFFLIFLLNSDAGWAAKATSRASSRSFGSSSSTVYLGTGAFFFNMAKVTSSNDASTSLIGQFYLPLLLTAKFSLGSNFFLAPAVTYTPLGSTAADSVKKTILAYGVNALYGMGDVDLKTGLGILSYSISGDGSTVTRNNGGSTATFYLPGSSTSSSSLYLDLGVSFHGPVDLLFDLDLIGVSIGSSRRALSSMLSVSKGVF